MNKGETTSRPLPMTIPFHYGWFVVFLSFFANLTVAAIRSAPSVLIHPLEAEFGGAAPRLLPRRASIFCCSDYSRRCAVG